MPFQKYGICLFIRKTCFTPDMFKFIYFHFLGQIVVIGEEVNGEIFLKFKRTSVVSKHESIYSLRNSLVHCINKQIYKYFGLNERSDNYNHGHNILELYNVLIQTRLTTSKTKRDI